MRPVVSIVIPTYNEGTNLFATVQCASLATSVPHEIIVIDDGSDDGSVRFLDPSPRPEVRLLRSGHAGPSHARNLGVGCAKADTIALLDAHCFPSRGWIEPALELLESDPTAIVTGCISSAGETAWRRGWGQDLASPGFDVQWRAPPDGPHGEVPIAGSAYMIMRSRRYFEIGGFFPFPVIGLEDIEFSIRQQILGGRILCLRDGDVAHVFAGKWRRVAERTDHAFNGLVISEVHLDGRWRGITESWFRMYPGYSLALKRLASPEVQRLRAFVTSRRAVAFEEFVRRFRLESAWEQLIGNPVDLYWMGDAGGLTSNGQTGASTPRAMSRRR